MTSLPRVASPRRAARSREINRRIAMPQIQPPTSPSPRYVRRRAPDGDEGVLERVGHQVQSELRRCRRSCNQAACRRRAPAAPRRHQRDLRSRSASVTSYPLTPPCRVMLLGLGRNGSVYSAQGQPDRFRCPGRIILQLGHDNAHLDRRGGPSRDLHLAMILGILLGPRSILTSGTPRRRLRLERPVRRRQSCSVPSLPHSPSKAIVASSSAARCSDDARLDPRRLRLPRLR